MLNVITNSDIRFCGLPREKIMHAPMIFLLCLPLFYNKKITTRCNSMPFTSFVGLETLSHISKEVDLCLNYDIKKPPTTLDIEHARALL